MKYLASTLLALALAVLLLWQLPWCCNFFFAAKPARIPFTLYSSVVGDFAMVQYSEGNGIKHTDASGRVYTQAEFDSILPLFYLRQLVADERFPDTLHGVPVTPRMAQHENFTFRTEPSAVNTPPIGLYPLIESMPGRVDLQFPADVFRITARGIEFVTMETNRTDTEKSRLFTEVMQRKGFRFPATRVAGNPSVKKEYDEGYLLLDADGKLFHLKQMRGRPFCRPVELPGGVRPKHLFVTEFSNRKTLAFFTDYSNALYVLRSGSYEAVRTGVEAFDPETDGMTVIGNMFDWTVRITSPGTVQCYALRAGDYSLIKKLVHEQPVRRVPGLAFTSSKDKLVKPRWE